MKKRIIYMPILLFCLIGFQLKAEENSNQTIENPILTEIQVVEQEPDLSSGLVWDKNKPPKKAKAKKPDFDKQLWRNLHLGWDIDKTDNYRWRNFAIGTGYAQNFESVPKAYWFVGGNLNWSKYTLYRDGIYSIGANNAIINTFSVSVPAHIGYNIHQNNLTGMGWKVYTGPTIELITSSRLDGYAYKEYNPFQVGWTIGTGFRFLHFLGFNVAYSYYPIAVFSNGNLVRSSVNFSLGF